MDQTSDSLLSTIASRCSAPQELLRDLHHGVGEDDSAFVERVVEVGLLALEDAWRAYADTLQLSFEDFDAFDLDPELLELLEAEEMESFRAVPVRWQEGMLLVAMQDPLDLSILDAMQGRLATPVLPAIATPQAIDAGVDARRRLGQGVDALLSRLDVTSLGESAFASPERLREIAGDNAIVLLVDHVIEQALRRGASDIHVEAGRELLRVRFRIDGALDTVMSLPRSLHGPLVTRLKIASELDIGERRQPQDGRFRIQRSASKAVEFRVSTLPAMHGEKVVMRILDKSRALLDLEGMELASENLERLRHAACSPFGMVLVTGPTGSGKTTTLYSVLSELNGPERNLVTTEDPVEYELPGVTQVQIDRKAGRSFASTLRSILRQDPDVIMVGEIRDTETAEIAVHAAMTGHLVLSTLHTNSALGTVSRLLDMGVPGYLLAPTLRAVVAQRLVRRICPDCAEPIEPPLELLRTAFGCEDTDPRLGAARFVRPTGCPSCRGRGYQGRLAIHEVLGWSEPLERLLSTGSAEDVLVDQARREGFREMRADGLDKAMAGQTTLAEVLAVTGRSR